jgi:hypothetical protein
LLNSVTLHDEAEKTTRFTLSVELLKNQDNTLNNSLTYNIVVDNRGRKIDFSSKECNNFGLNIFVSMGYPVVNANQPRLLIQSSNKD